MPSYYFADLVRETSSSTGTGPFVLAGAVPGHRAFAGVVPPSAAFHYAIAGVSTPDMWETGTGAIDAGGALVRTAVTASSAAGARVDFGAGLKTVALTVGAGWFAGAEAALDSKQPISTGHGDAVHGEAGDRVTVQRGAGWVNLALSQLAARGSDGRHMLSGPLAATAGSAAAPGLSFAGDSDSGMFGPGANVVALATGGVERARIDANGHLRVGASAPGAFPSGPGLAWFTPQVALTGTSEAAIGIGLSANDGVKNSRCGLFLNSGANAWGLSHTFASTPIDFAVISNGSTVLTINPMLSILPGSDNIANLGSGSMRFATLYAGSGTINTSDARDKAWRGALNAAEMRAAQRIAREIGVYQWRAAVAAKGADSARLHVGVRAQAVWGIMADEGLVDPIGTDGTPAATPYAFLCWDRWDDGDRYGVRGDQLALFIAAAHEARIAALEAEAAAAGRSA